ncbi:MAG: monovalent cation/H(+) antiporter subunit G [Candidatus Mcinerneyibacterium aminivorans]|uniref:Monovalent cation/H(+) antiporter subunit G n=1 Tax=Candidatus Mcinerneyibacterium aminivorans TaxID=2703815 RepID=A0A5D0MHQ9_9BACT|nr:MAG: monovalent cation/H(+) antiporter subunit G [Candidatus Mcinerneyibacterium aminivorans]
MIIVGKILILIGSIFLFLGGLGIFRMPDVYNRLQAGTKATTLGFMTLTLGVGFMHPSWFLKCIVIIIFIAFTNPVSSSVLAKSAYRRGVNPRKVDKK